MRGAGCNPAMQVDSLPQEIWMSIVELLGADERTHVSKPHAWRLYATCRFFAWLRDWYYTWHSFDEFTSYVKTTNLFGRQCGLSYVFSYCPKRGRELIRFETCRNGQRIFPFARSFNDDCRHVAINGRKYDVPGCNRGRDSGCRYDLECPFCVAMDNFAAQISVIDPLFHPASGHVYMRKTPPMPGSIKVDTSAMPIKSRSELNELGLCGDFMGCFFVREEDCGMKDIVCELSSGIIVRVAMHDENDGFRIRCLGRGTYVVTVRHILYELEPRCYTLRDLITKKKIFSRKDDIVIEADGTNIPVWVAINF